MLNEELIHIVLIHYRESKDGKLSYLHQREDRESIKNSNPGSPACSMHICGRGPWGTRKEMYQNVIKKERVEESFKKKKKRERRKLTKKRRKEKNSKKIQKKKKTCERI
ncbi:hypothetical protein MA16_Dca024836 [Dendrobium catenatum]|uniref:Uncharacterized protein n=1 Tax=Dendrobium catenatum TaxID=906689 RepID=A0A2I0WHZ7_9ASPA|nr:hypothetical protein MA16_Dca024836 [Dendrobium catenatum]